MSRPMRVVYVGTGISGRNTTLTGLVFGRVRHDVVVGVSRRDISTGFMRVTRCFGERVEVLCAVSRARAFYFYKDASEPDLSTEVLEEIETLRSVDGLVVVVDCRPQRAEAAAEALDRLHHDLTYVGRRLADIPHVFQLTHLDWPGASVPRVIAELREVRPKYVFESHPPSMTGTCEPLVAVVEQIVATQAKVSRQA